MDAIVGVWLTSILGAGAFAAAGYVLGQRGVSIPLLGLVAAPSPDPSPVAVSKPEPAVVAATPTPPPTVATTASPQTEPSDASSKPTDPVIVAADEVAMADDAEGVDRPTVVPNIPLAPISSSPTIPPPRIPAIRADVALADLEATKIELREALFQAEKAIERARAAEVVRGELERQIEALRAEVRSEVAARATASARAEELGDRLASASEEAASLRHKVSLLDRQTKQLREALQGRVRALTTSEWHRRRDLEEAEEVRVKLREVYEKIERTSLPPAASPSGASLPATFVEDAQRRIQSQTSLAQTPSAPPVSGGRGSSELEDELTRLREENRSLRVRALASKPPPRRSRGSVPDIDLDLYRGILDQIGTVAGLRGAVIADDLGSLLVGSGELAEGLAAFGAYIRDASARSDGLLPLDGVEEVDIRARDGMYLCTKLVSRESAALSLVMIGAAEASVVAAKKVAEKNLTAIERGQNLRLR